MMKLNNQKGEVVSPVFSKAALTHCSFPAIQKNEQIKQITSFQDKLFKLNALCFKFKANLLLLLSIRCHTFQFKLIGLRNFNDFLNNYTFFEAQIPAERSLLLF